jgi:capsid protein
MIIPEPHVQKADSAELIKMAISAEDTSDYRFDDNKLPQKEAYLPYYYVQDKIYDGEKTEGELGNPKNYIHDHELLTARSWQSYYDNNVAQILVKAYCDWIIGSGLNVQYEPVFEILADEGIKYTKKEQKEITRKVEQRFRLFTKSKSISHNKMKTWGEIQYTCLMSAVIGGDCLAIKRFEKRGVTVELVDSRDITDPDDIEILEIEKRGNVCNHGVEKSRQTGEHIAYHVKGRDDKTTRVLRLINGRVQASLIYGTELRIGEDRGIPLLAANLEKIDVINRYIEAIVSGEEKRANVAYFFEHNHFSDGSNPQAKHMMDAAGIGFDQNGVSMVSQRIAERLTATTKNQYLNMPIGVTAKAIESSQKANFESFVDGNFIYICASLPMPYEVALMKFVNSYSASRMATQTWQHIINIRRSKFQADFLCPYFELFVLEQILKGKINLPKYIIAKMEEDEILVQAFINSRFIGANVPQADPTKDTKAYVMQLQNGLINHETVTEMLGNGEFEHNINRLSDEYESILGKIPKQFISSIGENDNAENPQEQKTKEPKVKEVK